MSWELIGALAAAVMVAWLVLSRWVLPRFGAPT